MATCVIINFTIIIAMCSMYTIIFPRFSKIAFPSNTFIVFSDCISLFMWPSACQVLH